MKGSFRGYWLIETEVLCALALTVGFACTFVLCRQPYLFVIVSTCIGLATGMAFAYQRRFHRRIGSKRVRPPGPFRLFWRVVIVMDLLAVLVGLIFIEVRVWRHQYAMG